MTIDELKLQEILRDEVPNLVHAELLGLGRAEVRHSFRTELARSIKMTLSTT